MPAGCHTVLQVATAPRRPAPQHSPPPCHRVGQQASKQPGSRASHREAEGAGRRRSLDAVVPSAPHGAPVDGLHLEHWVVPAVESRRRGPKRRHTASLVERACGRARQGHGQVKACMHPPLTCIAPPSPHAAAALAAIEELELAGEEVVRRVFAAVEERAGEERARKEQVNGACQAGARPPARPHPANTRHEWRSGSPPCRAASEVEGSCSGAGATGRWG